MGREIIINKAFNAIDGNNKHIVLELATGVGKQVKYFTIYLDRKYNRFAVLRRNS